MLTLYRPNQRGKIKASPFGRGMSAEGAVWIDAVDPSDGELEFLNDVMGFEVPNRHDITEIELSNRLFKRAGSHVMIANLLPKSDHEALPPRPAAFILRRDLLLTIRFAEFYSFDRVAISLSTGGEGRTPVGVFLTIIDEAVGDRADDLEFSMRHMEEITSRLFTLSKVPAKALRRKKSNIGQQLDDALQHIGGMGERVANIRESIASIQRLLNYARTYIPESWLKGHLLVLDSLKNDITALSDEASFFMNKLSFNLDATLGMINIEENKVIRVLAVATLLLSPPTLIAGIYGMNFRIMPELDWPIGYGFALGLMVLTSVVSICILKAKHWF